MDMTQLSRSSRGPNVGEIRMHLGQRSMCINSHVQYAGGEGPLWVTEGLLMEFTLKGNHRYFRGYCVDVNPKTKTVVFKITEGTTWGRLAQGSTIGILASRFTRCHVPDPDAPNLVNETAVREAEIKARLKFASFSLERIVKDANLALSSKVANLVGVEYYQELASIVLEFNNLQLAVMEEEDWHSKYSTPNVQLHKRNLINAIKARHYGQGIHRDDE